MRFIREWMERNILAMRSGAIISTEWNFMGTGSFSLDYCVPVNGKTM